MAIVKKLFLLILFTFLITFTIEKKKRNNPYKTKEKVEQEEEFDDPELLGTAQIEEEAEETQEEEEKIEEESSKNQETTEEATFQPQGAHSEELEIEATEKASLFLSLFTIYEVLMVVFVVVFILNCMIGKSNNEKLANKWYNLNKKFFMKNYAHIGTDLQHEPDNALLKESYNNYKFYASGRENINSVIVSLDLSKRQDLVSLATSIFFPSEKDRLVYDISLNASEVNHVFCICRKKDVKYMKKNYTEIDFMTRNYDAGFINMNSKSKNIVLLTEDEEVTDKIFDRALTTSYEKIEKYIDIIYFTDRQTYSKENYLLFCSFNNENMVYSVEITKFVHLLADKLANFELNSKKKALAEKMRKDYDEYIEKEKTKKLLNSEEEKEKQAEEAKKKAEKLEAQKKHMTKEQLQKLEEKEKKDRIKKMRQKQIKVMK